MMDANEYGMPNVKTTKGLLNCHGQYHSYELCYYKCDDETLFLMA